VLKWFITFHLVVLGWILFRSPSLGIAEDILGQLGDFGAATLWTWPVVLAVAVVVGLQLVPRRPIEVVRLRLESLGPAPLGLALAAVVILVAATVPSQGVPPFIYFQF
jgi:alginate O-acetyltransferase complex protein AlgI